MTKRIVGKNQDFSILDLRLGDELVNEDGSPVDDIVPLNGSYAYFSNNKVDLYMYDFSQSGKNTAAKWAKCLTKEEIIELYNKFCV